jgi:hypothetical protein
MTVKILKDKVTDMRKRMIRIYRAISSAVGVSSMTVVACGLIFGNERAVLTGLLLVVAGRLTDAFA